jgi:hypothetical protein
LRNLEQAKYFSATVFNRRSSHGGWGRVYDSSLRANQCFRGPGKGVFRPELVTVPFWLWL